MVGRTVIRTESFLINGPDSPDIEMADNNCFRVIMIRQMFVDCFYISIENGKKIQTVEFVMNTCNR